MKEAKSYHHPDLRRALLDAALSLLREEGVKGFSMRKLAALAKVSHSAAYRHFASKDEIIAELMLEAHKGLKSALEAARAEAGAKDPRARSPAAADLMALSRAYVRFGRENPEHLKLMFSAEGFASLRGSILAAEGGKADEYDAFAVLEGVIKECQADGSLATEAYSGAMGFFFWSMVHGLSVLGNAGVIASMAGQRGWTEGQAMDAVLEAAGLQLGLRRSAGKE